MNPLYLLAQLRFDSTVTIGNVIQIIGFVIAVLLIYNKIDVRLSKVEEKVGDMWHWWLKHVIGNDGYIAEFKEAHIKAKAKGVGN